MTIGMRTLPEALHDAARSGEGYVFITDGVETRRSYAEIRQTSFVVARALGKAGVRRGDLVALVIEDAEPFLTTPFRRLDCRRNPGPARAAGGGWRPAALLRADRPPFARLSRPSRRGKRRVRRRVRCPRARVAPISSACCRTRISNLVHPLTPLNLLNPLNRP